MITTLGQVDSPMEESPVQRRGSRAYQIFPEINMDTEERLPSIVVEPTEQSELESGELCWPPRCYMGNNQEEDTCSQSTDKKKTTNLVSIP
uniref:LBH domain-containing protein n=1 Tax=Myripristis murdjan TaxID=586833 RepID=A0A667WY26_9TELE